MPALPDADKKTARVRGLWMMACRFIRASGRY